MMKKNWNVGVWIPVCIGAGTAIGVAIDNLAVGIGIGTFVGALVEAIKLLHRKNSLP